MKSPSPGLVSTVDPDAAYIIHGFASSEHAPLAAVQLTDDVSSTYTVAPEHAPVVWQFIDRAELVVTTAVKSTHALLALHSTPASPVCQFDASEKVIVVPAHAESTVHGTAVQP
jgi:hypothetical protein